MIISTAANSYQCCSVCGASPIEMNNLSLVVQKKTLEGNIRHRVSTLHAWIRFLDSTLHISYKMSIIKWRGMTEAEKNIVKLRKVEVQAEFRKRMGLVIDQPKEGGAGASNDGNTARQFFQQYDISANIMNTDADLMKRLHIILATMSCGYDINSSKFKTFWWETASPNVDLYPWYLMTQTLHWISIHGYEVIELFTVLLGMLSEEAQEATNKVLKIFRKRFPRKCDRKKTI